MGYIFHSFIEPAKESLRYISPLDPKNRQTASIWAVHAMKALYLLLPGLPLMAPG